MRTAGLPRLTRCASGQSLIPIGQIEELAISRSVDLLVVSIETRVVDRVAIAAALEGTNIEGLLLEGAQRS